MDGHAEHGTKLVRVLRLRALLDRIKVALRLPVAVLVNFVAVEGGLGEANLRLVRRERDVALGAHLDEVSPAHEECLPSLIRDLLVRRAGVDAGVVLEGRVVLAGVLGQVGLVEASVDALRECRGVEVPELQCSGSDLADLGRPERHAFLVDALLDAHRLELRVRVRDRENSKCPAARSISACVQG